ncbi:phasin family protein [Duganella sp. CF402]|uniref:phasin family protein n=1 Tax=unclassified Duganella TaxID=2636909 RepID=UPI0008B66DD8|nr:MULTISPECIES: phasin family protein [unclassified Duganella]RZT08806.1 phasin family protein [Duganella sp. BK701]SEL81270.1 phasin family protein [Duganella sp. CF402]
MSSITEQFSAATKSQLEAQFNIFSTLASTAVGSAEKVFALNLSTTKASVEKSSAAAKKLLTATDPKEFFSLNAAQPPSFDGLLAYGRELYSIATSAQNELIKSAQTSLKQVTDLAATRATTATKTPPALAAAVSAAVEAVAANEPVVAPTPKAPKTPKPAAAPIPEEDTFIEVKADLKPSFPEVPPKPIALAPDSKPAKAAPKAKK